MEKYLQQLNEIQQKAVVYCEGPQLIIAGAGSGKTRVLTYKIVHLILNNYRPFNILALTFTNKAAREMKNRMNELLSNSEMAGLWIGTFHSVFSKILRIEAQFLGYTSTFTIYDTDDSRKLIKDIVKEMQLDPQQYPGAEIHSQISRAKNNLILPEKYQLDKEIQEYDRSVKRSLTSDIYFAYQRKMKENNAMDFDDLLVNMNILFRDFPQVLEKYQNVFKYILVDEYQDTNFSQYLIIKKLSAAHHKLCVVGDDSQSIYAFRGARIENILNFKNDFPEYQLFKLEKNYRSTQTIVNAANSLIEKNKDRIPKNVFTENETGNQIEVFNAKNDKAEAEFIAKRIVEITKKSGIQYEQIAILYRTNAQSRSFEETLRRYKIPYKIYGSISFYQRAEIKDVLAYLRLIVNKNDNLALLRVINYPARGIGDTTIEKITKIANNFQKSIWEVIQNIQQFKETFNLGTIQKILLFVNLIDNFSYKTQELDIKDFVNYVIEKSTIKATLEQEKNSESENKLKNIEELVNAIADFSAQKEKEGAGKVSIETFLEDVALLTDQDKEEKEVNSVTLMTSHASKGLEFDIVFISGVEQGLFPSQRSLMSDFDIQEERRLMYVSMTRAKKMLFMSHCDERMVWGRTQFALPSMFLKDISNQFLKTEKTKNDISENKPQSENNYFDNNTVKIHTPRKLSKINSNSKNQKTIDTEIIDCIYKQGQKVLHEKFGKGTVVSIEGNSSDLRIEVYFEKEGNKKLLIKFAKLQILEN